MNWQPIETAPKDGTAILGYMPSRRGYVARQDVCPMHWTGWGGGTWESSVSGHKINEPVTHWMPLPAGPTNKSTPIGENPNTGASISPLK